MKRDIENNFTGYHGVFNLGIDANFTKHVVKRFDQEVTARKFSGADLNLDYAIVFAIGINDTLHLNDDYESTPEKYNQELELLLYKTKQLTARIAFLNLLPVDEKLNNKDTTKDGRYYTNRRIELFNNVLEKFCIDNKLALINVRKLFTDNYALLSSDGTHPNTKGHEAIYTSVMPTIKSWLYEQ